MKLKIFDNETSMRAKAGRNSINVSFKKGLIRFSSMLVNTMHLKKGDCISFGQDESNPKDWYLFKSKTGFELRMNKELLLLNNIGTVRAISDSLGIDYSTSFLVAKEPIKSDGIEYWPIITKSGIKSK
ncbi:MAG: hypothetical protein L6Q78_11110 [Bacteroidia bacterium]|nr:hypothetical protein [Bacteroidia bacterium]